MTGSRFKDSYFESVGLKQTGEGAREKLAAALHRAHDIRKFEIELYWKRATYFWAFQAAAFGAAALAWDKGKTIDPLLALAFSGIGFLSALVGYFAAQGSKFWQENWEAHIDLLEDAVEGRLYKTLIMRSRHATFSVSGLNTALHTALVVFWTILTFVYFLRATGWPFAFILPEWVWAVGVLTLILIGAGFLSLARTRLSGRLINLQTGEVVENLKVGGARCQCGRAVDRPWYIFERTPRPPN
jgi:hypothetical protein